MYKMNIPIKTLKNKFLVTMLMLTFLPIVIQTNISLDTSRSIMEKNYVDNYEFGLNVSSSNLDLLLEPIISISRSIIGNKELQSKLRKALTDPLSSRELQFVENVFGSAMTQSIYIDSIYLFTENNDIYYRHKNNDVSGYTRGISFDKMSQMAWYQETIRANGKEVFIGDNILDQLTNSQSSSHKYITCTKLFRNVEYPYESQGILVLNLRKELLESVFPSRVNDEPNSNYIYDTVNAYFFTKDKAQADHIDEKLQTIKAYLKESNYRDQKYIISSADNKTTGWKLYNIADRKWLGNKSNAIAIRSIGIAAGMFVVAAVAFIFISGAINRPLEKLEGVIKKIGQGNYDIEEEFDDSEIGEIGNQFITVVNKNIKLQNDLIMSVVKQREAEIRAMQEQINPHFLYNTLDLLYWKAEMSGAREIADITISLSNIFKLTLNNGELLRDIKDEIQHIKDYMNIQKMRYGPRLETSIAIDEELYNYKIVKLLLQPIVENAICHGIEPKIEGGKVSILGVKEGDKLIFTITDNGVGFNTEDIFINGYGFKNVSERIKLYYGDDCGITIKSKMQEGTCVTIITKILNI